MYIQPNTVIRILKNVPLDKTYEHTIYFSDVSSQVTYFSSKAKHVLSNQTYQRLQKGVARVQLNAESLYDCNYMMFQNTSFGSKWFYAFITAVEYVNDVTSDVFFDIDVMQTWFFDYTPNQCFVEREHSVTDNIGDNIAPEGVDTGEYVTNDYAPLTPLLDKLAVAVVINDTTQSVIGGNLIDNVFSGGTITMFNADDVSGIKSLLEIYIQKPDSVINMYMLPAIASGDVIPSGGETVVFSKEGVKLDVTDDRIDTSMRLNGYKPVNNKLYTYPYNFYHIDNASGSELTMRYEFFARLKPHFKIEMTIGYPPKVVARPLLYKGLDVNNDTYNCESIELSPYPSCSWSCDAYTAYIVQNGVPIISNLTQNGLTNGLQAMNGGAKAAGVNAINDVLGTLTTMYSESIKAPISKGNYNNGNINVAHGTQTFFGGRFSVTAEYAEMIDNFFTKFGYATKKLKRPNRSSRPHWNYVKTIGATITGSVPADDMATICGIYDKGITFWKNGNEVGNYSLNNAPA